MNLGQSKTLAHLVFVAAALGCGSKAEQSSDKSAQTSSATATSSTTKTLTSQVAASSSASAKASQSASSTASAAAVAASSKPAVAPIRDEMWMKLEGSDEIVFKSARGELRDGGIYLLFAGADTLDCSTWAEAPFMSVFLPPGPDGKFFAGAETGTFVTYRAWSEAMVESVAGEQAFVTLETVEPEGEGTVKGTLRFSREVEGLEAPNKGKKQRFEGGGRFEVKICKDLAGLPNKPIRPVEADAGDAPIADDEGAPFQTVIARLGQLEGNRVTRYTKDTELSIAALEFYGKADVTCDADAYPALLVTALGGTGQSQPIIGRPQPAFRDSLANHHFGWVLFDTISFKPGDTVKGKVLVTTAETPGSSPPSTTNKGTFQAIVCAEKPVDLE